MIEFNSVEFKTGNRHGIPDILTPRPIARMANFNDVDGEGQIDSGLGGRPITVNALVVDTTFTEPIDVYDYFNDVLTPMINIVSTLTIDAPKSGDDAIVLENCSFKGWDPVLQSGQQIPAPLPDLLQYSSEPLAQRVGPGGYWIEVVFRWYQLVV